MNKIIATLVALSAVTVFAAEPAKKEVPATPAPAASAPAKVEKKAEVKPTKSAPAKKDAPKADAKPATPVAK